MKNLDIRMLVSDHGLKYKDVADEMNITPEWLSRLLRNNLTPENKIRILKAIRQLQTSDSGKGESANDVDS